MSESVRLRGVHKQFSGNTVLHGIDLDIAAGSVTVILGPSGSGKSTSVSYTHLRAHET